MGLKHSKPVKTAGGKLFKGAEHLDNLVIFFNIRDLRDNQFKNAKGEFGKNLTADVVDLTMSRDLVKDVTITGNVVVADLTASIGETVVARIRAEKFNGNTGYVVRPAEDEDMAEVDAWFDQAVKDGVVDADSNVL